MIAMAWILYCALHSLLADDRVKRWAYRRWPRAMPYYRLAFNLQSTMLLMPILWLVYGAESPWLWRWQGAWAWLANGMAFLALVGIMLSTRSYDLREFLGLRQLQAGEGEDRQRFVLSGFHRYVRHPWYSLSLLLIWTRDMSAPLLVSALAITLYFIIGSEREERSLIARYGEAYRIYRKKVPGLFPLPWKYLKAAEAAELTGRPH